MTYHKETQLKRKCAGLGCKNVKNIEIYKKSNSFKLFKKHFSLQQIYIVTQSNKLYDYVGLKKFKSYIKKPSCIFKITLNNHECHGYFSIFVSKNNKKNGHDMT